MIWHPSTQFIPTVVRTNITFTFSNSCTNLDTQIESNHKKYVIKSCDSDLSFNSNLNLISSFENSNVTPSIEKDSRPRISVLFIFHGYLENISKTNLLIFNRKIQTVDYQSESFTILIMCCSACFGKHFEEYQWTAIFVKFSRKVKLAILNHRYIFSEF